LFVKIRAYQNPASQLTSHPMLVTNVKEWTEAHKGEEAATTAGNKEEEIIWVIVAKTANKTKIYVTLLAPFNIYTWILQTLIGLF